MFEGTRMARLTQANGETEVAARFATAAHEQVDRVAAQLAGLERQARASAHKAAGQAERARGALQQQTANAVERGRDLLRDQPLIGAALAFAAGIIVLAVLRGRDR
jgi:ElaB/YqjD/DUF883 family membrane-anchored ribosome-binding protein